MMASKLKSSDADTLAYVLYFISIVVNLLLHLIYKLNFIIGICAQEKIYRVLYYLCFRHTGVLEHILQG